MTDYPVMFQKIYQFSKQIPKGYLVLGAVLLLLLLSMLTGAISDLFSTKLTDGFPEAGSLHEKIVSALILAPLLETIFMQCAVVESFKVKAGIKWSVPVSAIIFGLFHLYNPFYFIFGVLAGFVLAFIYIIPEKLWQRFLITYATHLLYNLTLVVLAIAG